MSQNGTVAIVKVAPDKFLVKHVDSDHLDDATRQDEREMKRKMVLAVVDRAEDFPSEEEARERAHQIYEDDEIIEYGITYVDLTTASRL